MYVQEQTTCSAFLDLHLKASHVSAESPAKLSGGYLHVRHFKKKGKSAYKELVRIETPRFASIQSVDLHIRRFIQKLAWSVTWVRDDFSHPSGLSIDNIISLCPFEIVCEVQGWTKLQLWSACRAKDSVAYIVAGAVVLDGNTVHSCLFFCH